MQLSFGLAQAGRTTTILFKTRQEESTAYVSLSGCLINYILTAGCLSDLEKLFYILVNSLSFINLHMGGQRSIALPAESWAKRLNCSKSQVFAMQNSLEAKGYFIISRDRNRLGQNKRNLICPNLPDDVFKDLSQTPDSRVGGQHLPFAHNYESKLQYLDRTKMFIMIGYQLLKDITACKYLTPFHKLVWLDFYITCYKARVVNFGSLASIYDIEFSFITSYQQLEDKYYCTKSSLSKAFSSLEEIGLIKRERFYTKTEFGDQERQDRSIWKISLLSSGTSLLECNNESCSKFTTSLINTINGSNNTNSATPRKPNEPCQLIVAGQVEVSDYFTQATEECGNSYVEKVMYELSDSRVHDSNKICSSDKSSCSKVSDFEDKELSALPGDISCADPDVALSSLYYNKDLKIKDLKSNLRGKSKVIFNKFLSRLFTYSDNAPEERIDKKHEKKDNSFNIHSELIREKLKTLPKDKADKARKFAYSIYSKGLATGYAANLTKHELAKEMIYHAATWRPTKLGTISRDKEIDTAISVAWKAVTSGKWQTPLELAKAEVLEYEYRHHRRKYLESGVISSELKGLEIDTEKLLGKWCDLEVMIKDGSSHKAHTDKIIGDEDYNKGSVDNIGKGSMNATTNEQVGDIYKEELNNPILAPSSDLNYRKEEINITNRWSEKTRNIDKIDGAGFEPFGKEIRGITKFNYIPTSNDIEQLSSTPSPMRVKGIEQDKNFTSMAYNQQRKDNLSAVELKGREDSLPNLSLNLIYASDAISKGGIINNADSLASNSLIDDLSELHLLEGTGSCKIDMDEEQGKASGFTSIDKALTGILNNLSYNQG